jgi:hypothetical protein
MVYIKEHSLGNRCCVSVKVLGPWAGVISGKSAPFLSPPCCTFPAGRSDSRTLQLSPRSLVTKNAWVSTCAMAHIYRYCGNHYKFEVLLENYSAWLYLMTVSKHLCFW